MGSMKPLERRRQGAIALLVWDRATVHRGLRTRVFLDVIDWFQFPFPPYAVELNPVEYVRSRYEGLAWTRGGR